LHSPVAVDVPGGRLTIAWTPGDRAVMTGNAVREFTTSA
jgi:diaminopimelate epimerase